MTDKPLFAISNDCLSRGGRHAGQYLQLVGKTDLATLTAEEWSRFCRIMVSATLVGAIEDYHDELQPPF